MRIVALAALVFVGCSSRRPAFVAMPWGNFRLEPGLALPLTADGRKEAEAFFAKGGDLGAANPVMNSAQAAQKQILDALAAAENLPIDVSRPVKRFCDEAVALCRNVAVFRGRPAVHDVVDARLKTPSLRTPPIAVTDGDYWYLFEHDGAKLTRVTVVRNVERTIGR